MSVVCLLCLTINISMMAEGNICSTFTSISFSYLHTIMSFEDINELGLLKSQFALFQL